MTRGRHLPTSPSLAPAKMALEAAAQGCLRTPVAGALESLIDDPQLHPIRRHARHGSNAHWPFRLRRIYEINDMHLDDDAKPVQTLYEYTLILTELPELYFVIALLGLEFAINLGNPSVDGYEEWLAAHQFESPL